MTHSMDGQAARHAGGWIVLGGIFFAACLVFKPPAAPVPQLHHDSQIKLGIDINRADQSELMCIPGVGSSLASRIIEYRDTHGPFLSLSELEKVPGVGPTKAAQLGEALLPFDYLSDNLVSGRRDEP